MSDPDRTGLESDVVDVTTAGRRVAMNCHRDRRQTSEVACGRDEEGERGEIACEE